MWWVFWRPGNIHRYRQHYGLADLQYFGIWLTMALLWAPLLVPASAHVFNVVPLNNTVSTIFLVSFASSIWYIYTRIDLAGALLGVLFFHIHLIDKSAADGARDIALMGQFALIAAYSAPVVVSNATVEPAFPTSAFIVLLAGVGTWVAWHVGGSGFIVGLFVGLLVAMLWAPLILESGAYLRRLYRRPAGTRFLPLLAALLTTFSSFVLFWLYWLYPWER